MLITSLKRTALMIDTLFCNIPLSLPVHPPCNDLFPKYIKMYSHWYEMDSRRGVPFPSQVSHSACCVESPIFLYLLLTLIHPLSSPRNLVPGFNVPLSIVQYQQTVHWKRQKIAGYTSWLAVYPIRSITPFRVICFWSNLIYAPDHDFYTWWKWIQGSDC